VAVKPADQIAIWRIAWNVPERYPQPIHEGARLQQSSCSHRCNASAW